MKRKKLLIIFVLAVLMTGVSWFVDAPIKRFFVTPLLRPLAEKTYLHQCRGFPVGFYSAVVVNGSLAFPRFDWIVVLLDFLFWVLVLGGACWMVRKLKRRYL